MKFHKKHLIGIGIFASGILLISGYFLTLLSWSKYSKQSILFNPGKPSGNEPTKDLPFKRNLSYDENDFPIIKYLQNSSNKNNSFYYLPDWNKDSNKTVYDFLASRVISLKITITTQSNFGTGTIIAKTNDDQNDYHYYVLTNAHVAKYFLQDNYTASFTVSPFLSNNTVPDQSSLINNFNFDYQGDRFIDFKNPSKDTSVFWTATDIKVKDYQVWNNSKNQKLTNTSEQTDSEFINNETTYSQATDGNQGVRKKAKFMADLSILKLDFSNLFNSSQNHTFNKLPTSSNNQQLWSNYKNLFEHQVKNQDVSFSKDLESEGFIAGFPLSIIGDKNQTSSSNQKKVGFLTLGIYHINNSYSKGILYNDISFQVQKLTYNKKDYYVPIGSYEVKQMNLQAGASGSLFVRFKENKVTLAGIYWGASEVRQSSKKYHDSNSEDDVIVDVVDSWGNISPFIVDNQYDLIGGQPKSTIDTPKENNFCTFLANKKQTNSSLRTPNFCLLTS